MRNDDGTIETPATAGYALPGKMQRDEDAARKRRRDINLKIGLGVGLVGYLGLAAAGFGDQHLPPPTKGQEGRTVLYLDAPRRAADVKEIYRDQFEGKGPLVPDRHVDFNAWYGEFERVNGVEGRMTLDKGFYELPRGELEAPRLVQR